MNFFCKLYSPKRMKRYLAEIIGTFGLVFAGTGAIVIDDVSGNQVTHVGVALTFGLVVMAMIYAVGDISGAHLNPAVTLGFWIARRLPGQSVIPYVEPSGRGGNCELPAPGNVRPSDARSDSSIRPGDAKLCVGGGADGAADVRNPQSFVRAKGKGFAGRGRDRRSHRIRGTFRRSDFRGVDESSQVLRARRRQRKFC